MLDNTEVACKRLMMSERCKLGLLKVRRILRLQLFLMTSRHCLLFIVRLRRCARHRDIKSPSNGNSTFIYFHYTDSVALQKKNSLSCSPCCFSGDQGINRTFFICRKWVTRVAIGQPGGRLCYRTMLAL